VGFKQDEFGRSEVRAYKKRSRSNKVVIADAPHRRFIIEQEAARLHCYDLIGTMNEVGIWGR
jgi:hypothetical protein